MAEEVDKSGSGSQILYTCCKIEETCADLYRCFSEIYDDSPRIRNLWEKAAEEEDRHAEHFRLAYHLQRGGVQTVTIDTNKANSILAKVQSIYERVQKSPQPLKDALQFAIRLEQTLSEYYMDVLAAYADKDLVRIFSSMLKKEGQPHVLMLKKAYIELYKQT